MLSGCLETRGQRRRKDAGDGSVRDDQDGSSEVRERNPGVGPGVWASPQDDPQDIGWGGAAIQAAEGRGGGGSAASFILADGFTYQEGEGIPISNFADSAGNELCNIHLSQGSQALGAGAP